jgi:hypothetical protein
MIPTKLNGVKTPAACASGKPRSEVGLWPDGLRPHLYGGTADPIVQEPFAEY